MKTLLTFLLAASVVAPALLAEDAKPKAEAPARRAGAAGRPLLDPAERLKTMTEKLGLTPEQQEKVKAVYAKNVEKLKEMRQDKALTEETKREKFTEMRRTEVQEINTILTPEQQEKMKEMAKEMRQRAGGAAGVRKPGERPAQKPEQK